MVKIKQVETFVYRYPLETPVQTSFGTVTDRPMIIVKLTDQDNVVGLEKFGVITSLQGNRTPANLVQSVFAKLIYSPLQQTK